MRHLTVSLPACALAIGLASVIGAAQACTIDGKPSVFANGTRAVIYKAAPTAATYATWAHFAFPRAFRAGQGILLKEDDALMRTVLPQADLTRSWRWHSGDGTARTGDTMTHTYRRAGTYKATVDAYFKGYGWQLFDSVTVTVHR